MVATAPCAARADEQPLAEEKVAPTAFNLEEPEPISGWGVGAGKSYWVPALDIVEFLVALNLADRAIFGPGDYDSSWSTFEDNVKGDWVYDSDPFEINQFGHPYQGSMYHGFARSAGQGYWTAMGYTILGSALWETAGERTPPSVNDQITTGFGGTFLGEPLFRLASLTLESSDGTISGWRSFRAAVVSPATGWNRWAYGDRFDGVFRSRDPAVYTRGAIGANLTSTVESNVDLSTTPTGGPVPQSYERGEAVADFTVNYGLPGKPGYTYTRPFDYFHFQFTAATGSVMENLITHGLLWGGAYEMGDDFRGVRGLYGMYDYIAPQIFRVSTTALGLGTTGQWWLSRTTALQGEIIGGAGYGSAGVVDGRGARDYHNGITPLGVFTLRLILDDNVALDLTGRDYYVTDAASDEPDGYENIARGEAGITVRLYKLHGVTLKYTQTHRDASYATLPETEQTVGAVSLSYAYLGHRWFGAVDWRPEAQEREVEPAWKP